MSIVEYPPITTKPAYDNGNITSEWRNWIYWFYFALGSGRSPIQIESNRITTKDATIPDIDPQGQLTLNGIVWNNPTAVGQVCTMRNGVVTWKDPGEIETANTGVIRPFLTVQDRDGWLTLDNGTIGSFLSGASSLADDSAQDLFELIWDNTANAQCAVSGGRGADANQDWLNNKTIELPKVCGRGVRQTTTNCEITGAETVTMGVRNLPPHPHIGSNPILVAQVTAAINSIAPSIVAAAPGTRSVGTVVYNNLDPFGQSSPTTRVTSAAGDGEPQNIIQPTIFYPFMIKL